MRLLSATIPTATASDGLSVNCNNTKLGFICNSDKAVTLSFQVSPNGTNWSAFVDPTVASSTFSVAAGVAFASQIDISAFMYVRAHVANAAGSDAVVTVDGYFKRG